MQNSPWLQAIWDFPLGFQSPVKGWYVRKMWLSAAPQKVPTTKKEKPNPEKRRDNATLFTARAASASLLAYTRNCVARHDAT